MVAGNSTHSIAVIGGGIIGLASALELADRGADVTVFEPNWPPRGASWAAAGMLAPTFEAASSDGHPDLFALCKTAAGLWPDWAVRLETRTGLPSGYNAGPSLAVTDDPERVEQFRQLVELLKDSDQPPKLLEGVALHAYAAGLSGHLRCGLLLPGDGQADNRKTLTALAAACEAHDKIEIERQPAHLRLHNGSLMLEGYEQVLLSAGWQTPRLEVVTEAGSKPLSALIPALDAIQPVAGQMLSVANRPGMPTQTIRDRHLYIVPKSDRTVIGATSEPGFVLTEPVPDTIAELKAQAVCLCPAIAEADTLESWVGIRPGTPDEAPLLGPTEHPGIFVASGHYRNGILLAPLTAQIMTDLMLKGAADPLATAFSPDRVAPAQV